MNQLLVELTKAVDRLDGIGLSTTMSDQASSSTPSHNSVTTTLHGQSIPFFPHSRWWKEAIAIF